MTLRAWFAALVLVFSAAEATEPAAVHVAKIINFSCAACRASDTVDEPVRRAVQPTGGQFVYATVPDAADRYWRELTYYAVRDSVPDLEPRVRASLYKGAQDAGLPFASAAEVLVWLQQDLGLDAETLARIQANIDTTETRQALARAFRLVRMSGASRTPTYVVLKGDRIVVTLDSASAQAASAADLVRRVVAEVASAAHSDR
jgi:hypothetical protein